MTIGKLKSIVYLNLMKQQETMESCMLLCVLLAEGIGWDLEFREKDSVLQSIFKKLEPYRKKLLKLTWESCCTAISSIIGSVEPDWLVAMLDSPMLNHVDGEYAEFNTSKYGHLSAPVSREYGVTQECELNKTSIRRKEVRLVEATDIRSENLSAFAEKWGDDLKNFGKRYIWQWKIPASIYKELKENLAEFVKELSLKQDNIITSIRELGNDLHIVFSRLVAVYCAEWFKREFNGNDRGNNALEAIGLKDQGISEEIFCRAYGEENVYRAGNLREWLWSMYVQGGLPVNYIVHNNQNNQNNNMVDILAAYFAPEEQALDEDKFFHNQVMAQSESIRSYIDCLRTLHQDGNVGWPIAEEDLSREPFVFFRNFVLEGKRKANQRRRQSKFYLEWLAWKSNDNDQLAMALLLCLHSNPQTIRPNKDIPIETARMWGIPIQRDSHHDENLFEIVIKQGRIPLLTIPFYRAVGRDYFYNAGGFFKFILASDYGRYSAESHYGVLSGERRISWLHPLTIGWRTSEREGDTLQTLDLPPCIPFTLEQQNRWSSRKQVGEKALFVLDRMKFKVETGSPEVAVCGESLWIPVYSRIECSYGGKKLAILPYVAGTLYVEPQEQLFSNAVRYRNGKVEYRDKDDVAHPAFLIKPSTTFKGYIEDGTEAIRIRKNLKWNYAGQLGFCDVVVSDEATGKKATVSCFVIPDEATLERNLQHYQIRSSNLNAEILPVNSNEQVDTVPYTIRSGNDSLTLEVYRPISDDGSIFIRNTDVLIPANINYLPLKFLAFYQLRRVDEHGCVRLDFAQESDPRSVRNAIYRDLYYQNIQNVVSILDVKFMPYSSNVIENNWQGYFINLNGDRLISCRFLFYEFTSGDIVDVQCIEQDGKTVLHFDSSNEGMLFQTLAGLDIPPLYYFRPRYVPSSQSGVACPDSGTRLLRRKKRICRYAHQPDWDGAVRDFRLAIEHSLYFNVFDRLCALTWTSKDDFRDDCYQCDFKDNCFQCQLCDVRKIKLPPISFRFAQFFVSLCAQTEQVDYQALYRLSSEMLFDWWAVSRSTWLEVLRLSTQDEEQRARFRSAVQELLESKPDDGTMEPDKKRIVDEFWQLPMQFRRSDQIVNRVAQCLRGNKQDANMDMKHEQRSGRMSDFDGIKYADLYMLLCNTRQ
ncbi:hypothetical protein [uncultured Alistipes sp.]|uniref:hypothetical protein n=1 Tax=uncultured Alistipes sp. TaxID=538949 RepID=UPI0026389589|nr:hypothetical protein [uncultured Alistipes sp.]